MGTLNDHRVNFKSFTNFIQLDAWTLYTMTMITEVMVMLKIPFFPMHFCLRCSV